MVALALSGCAQQRPVMDPAETVAQLSTGAPLLHCREQCLANWQRAQPHAAGLDAAARWPELAALVISVGYQDDLTLYYLARAAEGLGYPRAAASYYRQSTYISGTSLSCSYNSRVCGGVDLPAVALARIEAIEAEFAQSRRQPPRRPATGVKRAPIRSKPQPAESGPRQPGPDQPDPDPVPPVPSRVDPVAKEYIEPPAAR